MIVYRLTLHPASEAWTCEYFSKAHLARIAMNRAKRCGTPARVDRVEIPRGREGLCEFLNTSHASHAVLEGTEEVARTY